MSTHQNKTDQANLYIGLNKIGISTFFLGMRLVHPALISRVSEIQEAVIKTMDISFSVLIYLFNVVPYNGSKLGQFLNKGQP